jgi:hypothetical protein
MQGSWRNGVKEGLQGHRTLLCRTPDQWSWVRPVLARNESIGLSEQYQCWTIISQSDGANPSQHRRQTWWTVQAPDHVMPVRQCWKSTSRVTEVPDSVWRAVPDLVRRWPHTSEIEMCQWLVPTVNSHSDHWKESDWETMIRRSLSSGSDGALKSPPRCPTALFSWGPIYTPMASQNMCVRAQGGAIWVETHI